MFLFIFIRDVLFMRIVGVWYLKVDVWLLWYVDFEKKKKKGKYLM